MNEIEQEYFSWLYDMAIGQQAHPYYEHLMIQLHWIPYNYTIPMDGNRYEDGISLRYLFGAERGYSDHEIATLLDTRSCSVFEVMVSLANRIEDYLVDDARGCQTHIWFFHMLESLGISELYSDHYDELAVDQIIDDCLNHRYLRDGRGGLFTIHDPMKDQRTVELWTQANRWIGEYISNLSE